MKLYDTVFASKLYKMEGERDVEGELNGLMGCTINVERIDRSGLNLSM